MKSNRSRIAFVVVSLGALASLRAVAGPEGAGRDPATRALSIFSEVFSLTRSNYVEPADSKALLEGAYDGMSDALDPFSYYVPASAMAAYKAQQSAGASAPGIVFARRGGYPVRRRARCPARPPRRRASRRATSSTRWTERRSATLRSGRSRPRSRGPEGSSVELGLFRGGDEKKLTIPVTRARFDAPGPSTKWERDVAIIRIPAFTAATAAAVRKELDEAAPALDLDGDPRPARIDRRRARGRGARGLALPRQGPDRDGGHPQGRRPSRSRRPASRSGKAGS